MRCSSVTILEDQVRTPAHMGVERAFRRIVTGAAQARLALRKSNAWDAVPRSNNATRAPALPGGVTDHQSGANRPAIFEPIPLGVFCPRS